MRSLKVAAATVYKHSSAAPGDGFMVGQCCAKAAYERKTLEIPEWGRLSLFSNWCKIDEKLVCVTLTVQIFCRIHRQTSAAVRPLPCLLLSRNAKRHPK